MCMEVGLYGRALTSNEIAAIYLAGSAGKCAPPPPCAAPPAGLVSWWKGETNANDALGLNNGVAEGSLTFEAGLVGQAFKFPDNTADVRIPASSSLNVGAGPGMSVEMWIKTTNVTSN